MDMSLSRKAKVGAVVLVAAVALLFVVASAAMVVKPACGCVNPDLPTPTVAATAIAQPPAPAAESAPSMR